MIRLKTKEELISFIEVERKRQNLNYEDLCDLFSPEDINTTKANKSIKIKRVFERLKYEELFVMANALGITPEDLVLDISPNLHTKIKIIENTSRLLNDL